LDAALLSDWDFSLLSRRIVKTPTAGPSERMGLTLTVSRRIKHRILNARACGLNQGILTWHEE
jgi:hypothetical protein